MFTNEPRELFAGVLRRAPGQRDGLGRRGVRIAASWACVVVALGCACRSDKEDPKKGGQPGPPATGPAAPAGAASDPKAAVGIPAPPKEGERPQEYSKRWLESADQFVKMWSEAPYTALTTAKACRALIEQVPLTSRPPLDLDNAQRAALIDAVTSIVAMHSSLGYEEYVRFAERRHARLNAKTLQRIRERQEKAAGEALSDTEVLKRVWDNGIFKDGEAPWRGLSLPYSAIEVRELSGRYETLQEELQREGGTPSTGFTYSPLFHEYPRSAQAQIVEDGKVSVATVRLLLQGRAHDASGPPGRDAVGPILMRFRWEPSSGVWLLDENFAPRREGSVKLPWF